MKAGSTVPYVHSIIHTTMSLKSFFGAKLIQFSHRFIRSKDGKWDGLFLSFPIFAQLNQFRVKNTQNWGCLINRMMNNENNVVAFAFSGLKTHAPPEKSQSLCVIVRALSAQ